MVDLGLNFIGLQKVNVTNSNQVLLNFDSGPRTPEYSAHYKMFSHGNLNLAHSRITYLKGY